MELSRECPICFEIYSIQSKPLISLCGHTFCETCLKSYITGNCICPVCNQVMPRDISSYIINYSLIPGFLGEKQGKKTSTNTNYDLLKSRLQQEIKYHEELSKTLDVIGNDFTECIKNSEFEIETCIRSLINILENTKTSLLNELQKVKISNEQKLKTKKNEIDNLIKIRKNIMIHLIDSAQKSTELSPEIQLEISSLELPKSHEIDLKRSEFNLKSNYINQDFISIIVKSLKFNDEKSVFEYQSIPDKSSDKNEQEKRNERSSREQNNYNEHRDPRGERPQHGYGSDRQGKRGGDQRRGGRPDYNRGEARNEQGNNSRYVPRAQQNREEAKGKFDFSDPNINLVWFIKDRNEDILLPEFASGQIERCRLKNMKKIRIFREGSVMFLADLIDMKYFKLDRNEDIIPGQFNQLFCRRA